MKSAARSLLRLVGLVSIGAFAFASAPRAADPGDISSSELFALEKTGAEIVVIDVRTPEEFSSGHVPGAVNVPRDQLPQRLDEAWRSRSTLVVYCERGPRALAAAATLMKAGFTNVRHLTGDMAGWRAAGLPIAR